MQIACMLPVILIGREREEDALHSMNLRPFRHGLYPCMVSPYFRKIKRLPLTSGGVCFFGCEQMGKEGGENIFRRMGAFAFLFFLNIKTPPNH